MYTFKVLVFLNKTNKIIGFGGPPLGHVAPT